MFFKTTVGSSFSAFVSAIIVAACLGVYAPGHLTDSSAQIGGSALPTGACCGGAHGNHGTCKLVYNWGCTGDPVVCYPGSYSSPGTCAPVQGSGPCSGPPQYGCSNYTNQTCQGGG